MTDSEFTTWLRGFLDATDGPLSEAQRAKIAEKLDSVVPAIVAPQIVPVPAFPEPRPWEPVITWTSPDTMFVQA